LSIKLQNRILVLSILSKLVINKSESKLTIFVFSVTNVFIIEAINKLRIVVLFKTKKALIEYIKNSSLVLSSSSVCFLNSYLQINQRNKKYCFLYYSLD